MMPVAIASGVGCSLVVSTDGLSGAAPSAADGGADSPTEAIAAEAGSEAGADAAAGPYCASLVPRPKFCVDFDTGSLADLGETQGTVALDSSLSRSPARSLSCEVLTGATNRGALFTHPFGEVPSSYDLSFDAWVDSYDATHDVELNTMTLRNGTDSTCRTDVSIRDGLWTVDESCESGGAETFGVSHKSTLAMQLGRWAHVDASVSFAPTRTLSLAVDGQVLLAAVPLGAAVTTGELTLQVGIIYAQTGATTAKVHLDNVRFDFR
jgi:hypothetical protein